MSHLDSVYDYMSYSELYRNKDLLSPNNLKKLEEKENFVSSNFPSKIIELFGGYEKFIDYPILEFKEKFVGSTDYIDRIKPADVTHPIMIGVDCYKRAFVTIRSINKYGVKVVDTLFQRYTDEKTTWSNGCHDVGINFSYGGYFFSGNSFRNDKMVQNLKLLLSGADSYTITNYKNEEINVYAKIV